MVARARIRRFDTRARDLIVSVFSVVGRLHVMENVYNSSFPQAVALRDVLFS